MTDADAAASLWTDRSFLRDVQYKTDVNLAVHMLYHVRQAPRRRNRYRRPA